MKRLIATLLYVIPLMAWCGNPTGFVIQGTIAGNDSGTVQLTYLNVTGDDTTINTFISNGKFVLTGKLAEPALARISMRGKSTSSYLEWSEEAEWSYGTSLFLENTSITLNLVKQGREMFTSAPQIVLGKTTGLTQNTFYQKLEPQQRAFFGNAKQYDAAQMLALNSGNAAAVKSSDSLWNTQLLQWTNSIKDIIKEQPKNYAALHFIKWLLFHPPAYDTVLQLFNSLDPEVKNGFAAKEFLKEFNHSRNISIGEHAPEISGSDTSGKMQGLAALKGKVVLLDFWASYCGPCRQANPQLKALYEKYNAMGFEILSVSLDHQRAAWVQAIVNDKMTWPQASELRGGAAASAAVYGVQELPRNWLIDRTGTIIARDVPVSSLDGKLEEILKRK
jgi:thiol-disulfide isomerase/thioredoxin